ncbi:MAG: DUF4190 domain-containing protein [Candidatus Woesearchaeota archaeon]
MAEQKNFHMAIASLVFSIIGLLIDFLSYIAVLVGIYAIVKIKNHPELKGTGLAIAGVTIAGLDIIIGFIFPLWKLSLIGMFL